MSLQGSPTAAPTRAEIAARRLRLGMTPKPAPHFVRPEPIADAPSPITLHRIIGMVSEEFRVSVRQMRSPSRSVENIMPRFAVMYLARQLTVHSYLRIAQSLHRSDHTGAVSGERRAKALMLVDHDFALSVVTVERRLVESAARYVMANLIVVDGKPVEYLECPHCQRVVFEAKRGT